MAKMWFGNVTCAQWVPAPRNGMTKTREGYESSVATLNGGLWIERSTGTHTIYKMDFPVQDASDYYGIEAFERYASGEYGTDYVRFIDPMIADQNLFTESWAAPGLSENGLKTIFSTTPTYSDTSANSYGKPIRKATYSVTTATNSVPTSQNSVFTLLIPDTYTLHIGGSGAVTGTAVLRVQPILLNGTLDTVVDITLTSDAIAPAFSSTFSGATYKAVRIYITRTSSAASTITLTSLWAQVLPTGTSPVIARHIPGKGHSGLEFQGSASAEQYVMANRHLVGASITLAEVEPWA